ncbi:MAG: hypothetical protein AAFV53_42015, partial [Myxococcota bacterium]
MSSTSFFQTSRGSRRRMPRAFIGDIIRDVTTLTATGINKEPQSRQVTTVGVPSSPTAGVTYTVEVNGMTSTYLAENPTSQDAVGAGLAAAINANPAIRGTVQASYTGGTLTLTANWPAVGFVVTLPSPPAAPLTGPVTTAAQKGKAIGFGRVLVTDGYVSDQNLLNVFVPTTSNLKAQVTTLTIVHDTNEEYLLTLTVRGQL